MGDKVQEPKGFVKFFEKMEPVTWERETKRYVYGVKRLKKENHTWKKHKRNFEDKMEKTEIMDGAFKTDYKKKQSVMIG